MEGVLDGEMLLADGADVAWGRRGVIRFGLRIV